MNWTFILGRFAWTLLIGRNATADWDAKVRWMLRVYVPRVASIQCGWYAYRHDLRQGGRVRWQWSFTRA